MLKSLNILDRRVKCESLVMNFGHQIVKKLDPVLVWIKTTDVARGDDNIDGTVKVMDHIQVPATAVLGKQMEKLLGMEE